MEMARDFVVESNGHCFLCLDQISSQLPLGTHDHGSPHIITPSTPLTCSLQSLSRYLGIGLRKVFHSGADDIIPAHLFETIKNSKLRGELCEECRLLNANFGIMYQKLEKIQMDVVVSLKQIFLQLLNAEEAGKFQSLRGLSETAVNPANWKGELDVLEGLRTETIENCLRILSVNDPRVKLQNMSNAQIKEAALGLKKSIGKSSADCRNPASSSTESEPVLAEVTTVKIEYSSAYTNPSSDEDNNYYPDVDSDVSSYRHDMEQNLLNTRNYNKTVTSENTENKPAHLNIKIKCIICGKEFWHRNSYQIHRLRAHKFSRSKTSKEKMQSRLNPETGKYKCGLCVKEFQQLSTLQRHHSAVHVNVIYKCGICETGFKYKQGYQAHCLSAHKGVRFPCKVCGKGFTQKSSMRRHLRLTSCKTGKAPKPKKYICHCKICGQGFTRKDYLKRHVDEVHLKSGKYVCDRCGKRFIRRDHLIRHEREVNCTHD